MLTAHRVRTSVVLAGAAGAIVAALCLTPRPERTTVTRSGDDGMQLDARLVSSKILPGPKDHELAVTITVPGRSLAVRPPLSLVVVIDRSGSMQGTPLRNAKAAAGRLISQLDERDAFSVVTYSSGDETVFGMARATPDAKRQALYGIETITDEGGTCISCGITRGTTELARSPITGGVRRIVLVSDGQANEGIWNRDELVQFASDTATKGISISAVGVGLDFDEVTMTRIANVGRGNYYFASDTTKLDAMFAHELGGLAHTVATNVQLVIGEQPGMQILEAYGYPMKRVPSGDALAIPIADLRAGETRKIVLKVRVSPSAQGAMELAKVGLAWHRSSDDAFRTAKTIAQVEVVDDLAAVTASIDPKTLQAVEAALSARALEEANEVYDTVGVDAARQVLERRGADVRGNPHLDATQRGRLERDNEAALDNLRREPGAKAKKENAAKAYELAR